MGCAVSHQAADNLVLKDKYPVVGSDLIMCQKAHGTSDVPVQSPLRWGCSVEEADRICNFNRHYAEASGRSLLSICPFFLFLFFKQIMPILPTHVQLFLHHMFCTQVQRNETNTTKAKILKPNMLESSSSSMIVTLGTHYLKRREAVHTMISGRNLTCMDGPVFVMKK